jgi:hypothetical protein
MVPEVINYDGTVIGWVLENIKDGQNFKVYAGDLCEENEISRDVDKMYGAQDVSIILMSAGFTSIFIAVVVSVGVTLLLTPDIPNVQNDSGRQSPNNSLTDRRNKARPNQRIPDICGKVKSIPDVIASEYSRYVDNKEERYGYYCIARNQVQVEEIKDGDTLLSQIDGASAGVYYPNKSPDNSAPDIQIGNPINQLAYGVYQSGEAIGQTILAPNEEDYTVLGAFNNTTVKCQKALVNVYSPNGMYRQDEGNRLTKSVSYRITVVKLDEDKNPIGTEYVVDEVISGNNSNEKGKTTEIDFGGDFFFRVSVQRISNADFSGQAADEIKLKDIFGLYEVDKEFFGNTTTIQTKRIANAQNASIRNPEINCIATEMVYKYLGNGAFDTVLTPNTQAMQSLIRLALDPYVGRRDSTELDLDGLIANQVLVEEYFNSEDAGQFSYTFDDENTSAQEILYTIANAAFCQIWREGRVLKSYFERPQSIPAMVFTHRSKAPNSETWSRETAQGKRKDSVELTYTDKDTYKKEVLYFPEDRSGRNPKKVEAKGVKGKAQATWRLMREYNKLVYSKESVEFTATLEGSLVKPMQLISVVKGARVGSYDGEILNVDGLTLELSQEIEFTAGDDHFILLKKRDGTLESIPVIDIGERRKVQIEYAPQEAIYTGNSELKTEFSFGNEARLSGQLVIPLEIDASDGKYAKISAINYSDRYYDGDLVQVNKGDFNNDFNNDFGG